MSLSLSLSAFNGAAFSTWCVCLVCHGKHLTANKGNRFHVSLFSCAAPSSRTFQSLIAKILPLLSSVKQTALDWMVPSNHPSLLNCTFQGFLLPVTLTSLYRKSKSWSGVLWGRTHFLHVFCLRVQVLGKRKPFSTWYFESTTVLFRVRFSDTLWLAWVWVCLMGLLQSWA